MSDVCFVKKDEILKSLQKRLNRKKKIYQKAAISCKTFGGWLVGWLVLWLVRWFFGCSMDWMINWLRLQDSQIVIEKYKSGFLPPTDYPFEDLSTMDSSNQSLSSVCMIHSFIYLIIHSFIQRPFKLVIIFG